MKKLITILMLSVMMVGCGNQTFDKAFEEAKLAVANGEFEKAMGLLDLALNEKPDDQEAKKYYDYLVSFNGVKEEFENKNWTEVLKKADELTKQDTLNVTIKKEMESYVETATKAIELDKNVQEIVKKSRTLMKEEKYKEAQTSINELKKDKSYTAVLTKYEKELASLEDTIQAKIKEDDERKKSEAVAKEKETKQVFFDKNAIFRQTDFDITAVFNNSAAGVCNGEVPCGFDLNDYKNIMSITNSESVLPSWLYVMNVLTNESLSGSYPTYVLSNMAEYIWTIAKLEGLNEDYTQDFYNQAIQIFERERVKYINAG